ncbi:hypothetical protein scyTo_0006152 [Scyliorhinus torazame]|uniref:Uncharacterized protein n=1 Tax=Scyliorhinus torazame TaxID=75743 RepID=A0A401PFX4_SCYTO|nr:hypothetical protein [Scyliorhinus torazame]
MLGAHWIFEDKYEIICMLSLGRRWNGAEGFVFCCLLGTGEICLQSHHLCQKNMQIRCSPDIIQAWGKF